MSFEEVKRLMMDRTFCTHNGIRQLSLEIRNCASREDNEVDVVLNLDNSKFNKDAIIRQLKKWGYINFKIARHKVNVDYGKGVSCFKIRVKIRW